MKVTRCIVTDRVVRIWRFEFGWWLLQKLVLG